MYTNNIIKILFKTIKYLKVKNISFYKHTREVCQHNGKQSSLLKQKLMNNSAIVGSCVKMWNYTIPQRNALYNT